MAGAEIHVQLYIVNPLRRVLLELLSAVVGRTDDEVGLKVRDSEIDVVGLDGAAVNLAARIEDVDKAPVSVKRMLEHRTPLHFAFSHKQHNQHRELEIAPRIAG